MGVISGPTLNSIMKRSVLVEGPHDRSSKRYVELTDFRMSEAGKKGVFAVESLATVLSKDRTIFLNWHPDLYAFAEVSAPSIITPYQEGDIVGCLVRPLSSDAADCIAELPWLVRLFVDEGKLI